MGISLALGKAVGTRRNYWPLGILVVLLIGLVLIIALVVVAIRYAPQSDTSYLHQHTYTDSHINDMLAQYQAFSKIYALSLSSGKQNLEPTFPFYFNPNTPLLWLTSNNNQLTLIVHKNNKEAPSLRFTITALRPRQKPILIGELACKQEGEEELCSTPLFNLPLKGNYKLLLKAVFQGADLPLIQPAYVR